MTEKEFDKLLKEFEKNGYTKYQKTRLRNEDYYFAKSFHKTDNIFEENRYAYHISYFIYDWRNYHNPTRGGDPLGIDIEILVSRTSGEYAKLELTWKEDDSIEYIEQTAESFFNWASVTWNSPRDDNYGK